MKIKVINPDAAPGTVEGTFGVSDKFSDPELQRLVAERIGDKSAAEVTAALPAEAVDAVNAVLQNITSDTGVYQEVPRSLLEPTPDEWNRFSPIPQDRFVVMAESIYSTGLQQPIVVRVLDENATRLQILAGNNRNRVYDILAELTHDSRFDTIPAIVYGYGIIDDDRAAEIASDTNFLQRGNLNTKDMSFAVYTKAEALRKRHEKNIMGKISEQLNFKKSAAYEMLNFYKAPTEFQNMNLDGKLMIKSVARIGSMPENVQEVFKKNSALLTNDIVLAVPKKVTAEEAEAIIETELEKRTMPKQQLGKVLSVDIHDGKTDITVDKEIPEGSRPMVVAIPEKLMASFLKKYQEYVFA